MTLVAEPPPRQTTTTAPVDQPEVAPAPPTKHFPAVYPLLPADEALRPLDERVRSLYLSPDGFRHWLETRPAGGLVGGRQDAQSCPLATFGMQTLRREVGGLSVHCDRIYILPGGAGNATLRAVPTPTWCMRFIRAIDRGPVPLISAAQALGVLRTLEKEAPL